MTGGYISIDDLRMLNHESTAESGVEKIVSGISGLCCIANLFHEKCFFCFFLSYSDHILLVLKVEILSLDRSEDS